MPWRSRRAPRAGVLPIAPDLPGPLTAILERGLESDILIITGGVSAGERDLVPAALDALGVRCVFHKVRLKPGKPLWFGVGPPRANRPAALVFGLPGNPVSGLVGFLLFVARALAVLAGKPQPLRRAGHRRSLPAASLTAAIERLVSRPGSSTPASSPPVCRSIEPLAWHGSADLRATAEADGFAIFAAGDRDYEPGEIVDFLPFYRYPT